MEVSSDAALAEIDAASQPFLGRWHHLVSTTNWEKGRIIGEWRTALIDAGSPAAEYADEAWANRVGGVTAQHVGRLRRVWGRFADSYQSYKGLYWSHFQAALDWDDAEMWLEGALQNDWSVGQMRQQRAGTLGDVAARTDELAAQVSAQADVEQAEAEDTEDQDDRISPSVARLAAADLASHTDDDETLADDIEAEAGADEGEASAASPRPAVQPFADLPELPDDLQAAFDTFKLAILNHRRTAWQDVSCGDVVATLDALKTLALAPLDD